MHFERIVPSLFFAALGTWILMRFAVEKHGLYKMQRQLCPDCRKHFFDYFRTTYTAADEGDSRLMRYCSEWHIPFTGYIVMIGVFHTIVYWYATYMSSAADESGRRGQEAIQAALKLQAGMEETWLNAMYGGVFAYIISFFIVAKLKHDEGL